MKKILELQSCSYYFETFLCFTKFIFATSETQPNELRLRMLRD